MESAFILGSQELSTDEALDRINNNIYTACSKSLKQFSMQGNSKIKVKPKRWFDQNFFFQNKKRNVFKKKLIVFKISKWPFNSWILFQIQKIIQS